MEEVDRETARSALLIKRDRFSFCPLATFYATEFVPIVAGEFRQQDVLVTLGIWAASLLVALVLAVLYLCQWRWKKLLSIVTAPFLATGLIALQFYSGLDVQWTNFQIMRPYYLWSVHGLNHASFEWPEHGIFLGGGWNETLIYDATGRIETDPKGDEALAKYAGDVVVVRNMGSHFYLVTSSYGL